VQILEGHHRLDDVVQTLQACGQRDLDPSPNGGSDIFEFDADASDAIGNGHAADCSDFMCRRQLDGTTRLPPWTCLLRRKFPIVFVLFSKWCRYGVFLGFGTNPKNPHISIFNFFALLPLHL
jgi:hypothetical protein